MMIYLGGGGETKGSVGKTMDALLYYYMTERIFLSFQYETSCFLVLQKNTKDNYLLFLGGDDLLIYIQYLLILFG